MSQTHSAEKDEKEDTVSPLPHIKNNKEPTLISITSNDRQIIEPATTEESNPSKFNPPKSTILQSSISNSTPNLLSANFNPSQNPKKDELVQNASIKILEVESLLDKLSDHVDRHHRKSSQKLQDFEQIHSELSKIQSTLVDDGTNNEHGKNKPSHIDPFIIIASTSDNDEKDDEKKENKTRPKKIRNNTLTMLEPFQCLVDKIQKEIVDPNITSSDESGDDNKKEKEQLNKKLQMKRKSSIKMKKSELINIQEYVQEHRNKMKEKTYQYEEKKRQLKSAKERLNKAKARFKKRLNKSKQRSARNRAYSDNKKNKRPMLNMHAKSEVTTGYGAALSPKSKFRTINEHSDADTDLYADTLSAANLSKFNNGTARTSTQSEHAAAPSTKHYVPIQNISAPIHLGSPKTSAASTPGSNRSNASNGYYNYNIIRQTHNKNNNTNSSVQSAFSTISDQSFVDDFHSIAAELESIDNLVRDQVSTPSMTSLLLNSPRRETSNGTSPENKGGSKKQFSFKSDKDDHIRSKMSSYSESDSKETGKTMQSYCSSVVASETDNSLQSEILHLHDIEQQISEI